MTTSDPNHVTRDDLIAAIYDIQWRYPDDIPSLADVLLHRYWIVGKVLHPETLELVKNDKRMRFCGNDGEGGK